MEERSLSTIAAEIARDWGNKAYFGAVPYIHAMRALGSVSDDYGDDSGEEIVLRFLGNAHSWRGETARRVKAELKRMVGVK